MIADMVPPWGTKVHYMSGIHTNVTTVQLPSGQARYSYLRDKPQNGEMTLFMVYRCRPRFIEGKDGSTVGIELRRAGCRWRVTKPALSIASWVLISTVATFSEAPL